MTGKVHHGFSVGEKLTVLLAVVAVAAAGVIGWRVYATQSDQIHRDFASRARLVSNAVEAATITNAAETDSDRLQQLAKQQSHIEQLITREPSLIGINIFAVSGDEIRVIGSSDRSQLFALPTVQEQAALEAALAGAEVINEGDIGGENAYQLVTRLDIEGQPPLAIFVFLSTSDRDAALVAVQRTFAITLTVAVVIALAFMYFFTRLLVTKPLQRLDHAAEQMRQGDYSTRVQGTPRVDARDEIVRLSADFNSMAAAIETLHKETTELASTDPLTKLFNRRYFVEALDREMARSRRDRSPLAAVILDLDGFKAVNDRYGHAVGDEALQLIADALSGAVREGDLSARFGGDEFVALMPNCDGQHLQVLMERVRARIDELHPPRVGDGQPLHVTVSVGGALLRDDDTADTFMQRADLALFEAKNSGRNVVRIAA